MPATPVGQIPYPQGTDRPMIPSDMKNLATAADAWVSGLDNALAGRVTAVGSRLDVVTGRLNVSSANLTAATTALTAGDTAITSAQNSLTTAESRLATQDATATALQTRYNTDAATLANFTNRTPLGVVAIVPRTATIDNSNGQLQWLQTNTFGVSASAPSFRASFNVNFLAYTFNSGQIEYRICIGIGSPQWNSFGVQAFFSSPTDILNPQSFQITATVKTGSVNAGTVAIALGCQGSNGFHYQTNINSGSIEYLATGA